MLRIHHLFCRQVLAALAGALLLNGCQVALGSSWDFTSFRYPGTSISAAYGMNNHMEVVGFAAEVPGSSVDPTGFLYRSGTITPIVYENSGTQAFGINDLGIVVGQSSKGSFLYDSSTGVYTGLSAPGAHGINNLGQIVGTSSAGAYWFDGSTFHAIAVPGASSTSANGVNDKGQIVGSYSIGSTTFGFFDDSGIFTSIFVPGAISTQALGINNFGQIVGTYSDRHGNHGFLDRDGLITTFDVPDAYNFEESTTIAAAINDDGAIAGTWQGYAAGQEYAYIVTPEPGSLCLLGMGVMALVSLAGARRRTS